MMTFPIKKRKNTELFNDRKTALYIGETQIRVGTNEGDQPVGISWLGEQVDNDIQSPGVNLSGMEFNRNMKETEHCC